MKNNDENKRRKFLRQIGATTLASAATPFASFAAQEKAEERILRYNRTFSNNDTVRIGVIGYGVQGHFDLRTALQVPGVELAGICDIYKSRLTRAQEEFGKDLFVTRSYKELLAKDDIDAVLICTTDVWHSQITLDALAKGKHIYLEKPMMHKIEEGYPMMKAAEKSGKVFQVGSQRVSSVGYAKAKELLAAGEIGDLNMVQAAWDRQSSIGAWEYTIPDDASPETTDWDTFTEVTDKMEFDAKKFFWWRAYKEFGTGVAGDLYIHLLSGTHFITNSKGPESIYSTGQFSYWNDGRNMPDVMSGVMQYPKSEEHPAFQLNLRVNFISGTGGQEVIQLIGSEGTITIDRNDIIVSYSKMPEAPGFGGYDSVFTFPEAMQERMKTEYNAKWTEAQQKRHPKGDVIHKAPEGYSDHLDHFTNFFDAIRDGKEVVEDAEFGFRAAAPALACNTSYFDKKIMQWDPIKMKLV